MLGEGVSRLKTQTKKYILISTTTLVTISLVTISLITITAITIMTMRASGETFLVEAHTPQMTVGAAANTATDGRGVPGLSDREILVEEPCVAQPYEHSVIGF